MAMPSEQRKQELALMVQGVILANPDFKPKDTELDISLAGEWIDLLDSKIKATRTSNVSALVDRRLLAEAMDAFREKVAEVVLPKITKKKSILFDEAHAAKYVYDQLSNLLWAVGELYIKGKNG